MDKKLIYNIVRIILGLSLLFFGVGGLLQLFPPPEFGGAATAFLNALFATGYLMQFVALVEIVVGILFLANRYVALGAVLLMPLSVNFVLFHLFLHWRSILGALVILLLNVVLIAYHCDKYKPLLKPR